MDLRLFFLLFVVIALLSLLKCLGIGGVGVVVTPASSIRAVRDFPQRDVGVQGLILRIGVA